MLRLQLYQPKREGYQARARARRGGETEEPEEEGEGDSDDDRPSPPDPDVMYCSESPAQQVNQLIGGIQGNRELLSAETDHKRPQSRHAAAVAAGRGGRGGEATSREGGAGGAAADQARLASSDEVRHQEVLIRTHTGTNAEEKAAVDYNAMLPKLMMELR